MLHGQLTGHSGVEDPSAAALGSGSPVVQGFEDHYQLGEVRPLTVHSCPVSEVAGRQISRGGVTFGSSSGSLSGNGNFFSPSSVTTGAHVAAGVGPHGFAGAFIFSRSLTRAFFAVASQGSLVPHGGLPGRSDSSVAGRVPKIVDLLRFTALHRQLAPPALDRIGLFFKG